jgi:glucose-6-phosphate 1-dehydrogenase
VLGRREGAGIRDEHGTVQMRVQYGGSFDVDFPEAYERLALDAMLGDARVQRGRARAAADDRGRDRLRLVALQADPQKNR